MTILLIDMPADFPTTAYDAVGEKIGSWVAGAVANPTHWAKLRMEIERSFAAARDLKLDRKQTMLGAIEALDRVGNTKSR